MRYPAPRYSFLAFQFNMLLDQGVSLDIEEVRRRIDDGSLFEWLTAEFGQEPHYLDLSLYDDEAERQGILEVFGSLANAVDADRKMGVKNNGAALLTAFCVEVMQHPESYEGFGD